MLDIVTLKWVIVFTGLAVLGGLAAWKIFSKDVDLA